MCAQDDYCNHAITVRLPRSATLKDLVDYLRAYHDDNGYAAIPYTGGKAWWRLMNGTDNLAEISDDSLTNVRYNRAPDTSLLQLKITRLSAVRVSV